MSLIYVSFSKFIFSYEILIMVLNGSIF